MGTYTLTGTINPGAFLDDFFPISTSVAISATSGVVSLEWFRFGDPQPHITMALSGSSLTVSGGALTAGTVQSIDFFVYDQNSSVGTLSGLGVDGADMQFAIDAFFANPASPVFPAILATNANFIEGSSARDDYTHHATFDASVIRLFGGKDIYRHVVLANANSEGLVIDGGSGMDLLETGTSGRVTVDFENDFFIDSSNIQHTVLNFDEATGLEGGDVLRGALDRSNRFNGMDGADFLQGGDKGDWLRGGAGQDTIFAGGGNDLVFGDQNNDDLDGGDGIDTVSFLSPVGARNSVTVNLARGTATGFDSGIDRLNGFENIIGSYADDTLIGDDGNNVITGHWGDDLIDGGAGSDTASYADARSGVEVYLMFSGRDVGADRGRDNFVSIENLIGSAFDDRLSGDASANRLIGGDGDDILKGMGGKDRFDAGEGDDIVTGDTNDDWAFGGDGNDTLIGLGGEDELAGGAGDDFIFAGQDADVVTGGRGADRLRGNLGNDKLDGGQADDDLRGGGGNDMLNGGSGNDVLIGSGGADVLRGGSGDDVMTGGVGGGVLDGKRDTFIYAEGGFDRIKDWEVGIDRLDLTALGFTDFTTDIAPLASDRASGLRFDFSDGDVLFVDGLSLASFDASDLLLA